MAKAGRGQTRRDSKRRVLRPGESIRADGKYQYKYHIDGKPHFVYSWKLEPTDKLPKGKKPCLSLRELEKQVNTDLDLLVNIVDGQMTVCELVDRYLKTKTGVRQSTKQGYATVQRLLAKEAFGKKTIRSVKTSDANPNTETDNMVNLYAFYILEIALRIAVLEVIGVNVSDDVKNYVMDEHLDWIKLEKHLDEDCVLPMNVFRQMIEKLQNQEQNS